MALVSSSSVFISIIYFYYLLFLFFFYYYTFPHSARRGVRGEPLGTPPCFLVLLTPVLYSCIVAGRPLSWRAASELMFSISRRSL